ncbi:MAG: sensor domain-containing diguanylate cyclase [Treponema sp.]|nr:sensor domain-containing diguanylate cyclase [Treponema sp.]
MKLRIFISVVLFSAVAVVFALFVRIINLTVFDTAAAYLHETARLYAGTFKIKLNDQFLMLEDQARCFSDVDMTDTNAIRRAILETKRFGEFKRFSVATATGENIGNDGNIVENVGACDYFLEAMQGMSSVSSDVLTDSDGERVMVLAVPVWQGDAVVGVITGTFAYSSLDGIFAVDAFGGDSYSFLVDPSGRILVSSENEKKLCTGDNCLDYLSANGKFKHSELEEMHRIVRQGGSGRLRYAINQNARVLVYTPVQVKDWYVLSVVTEDFINAQRRKITLNTLSVIALIALLFALCALLIALLARKNAEIQKDNRLLMTATENTESFIYEYEIETQVVTFTGGTEFLFGVDIKSLSSSQFDMLEHLIHRAEKGLLYELSDFIKAGDESFSREVRLLRTDGTYAWYRVTAARSKESNRIVGNVTNVNEQVIRELELKEKAETDLLSGLLNKVSMEQYVKECINARRDTLMGAFYIIDLDNFKQVNDRIGHSIGDAAICEAATKLKLVFSERDYIGRIGGDEFCVFLTLRKDMPPNQAVAVIMEKARTLCAILEDDYHGEGAIVQVTASIGLAIFPQQASSYRELFKRADTALYHVKRHGKNGFAVYEDNMKKGSESLFGE